MALDISIREVYKKRLPKGQIREYVAVVCDGDEEVFRSDPLPRSEAQAQAVLFAADYEDRELDPALVAPRQMRRATKIPQEEELFPETRPKNWRKARAPRMS